MSFQFKTPTQCSDDVGHTPPVSYQTGQEVPGAAAAPPAAPPAAQSLDIQTDASRYEDFRAPIPPGRGPPQVGRAPAPRAGHTITSGGGDGRVPDTMTITGREGTITATGLAGAIQPGVHLQIGYHNDMTVFHNGDGTTRHFTSNKPIKVQRQFPLTTSQEQPKERHLRELSKELSNEIRPLGRVLGLSDAALDQIQMNYGGDGRGEVNHQVLMKWMQSCPATLQALAMALDEVGRGDLADKLSQMS